MASRTYVLNPTNAVVPVTILNEAGERDEVWVQPEGRPFLQDGWYVDPVWMSANPRMKVVTVEMEGE